MRRRTRDGLVGLAVLALAFVSLAQTGAKVENPTGGRTLDELFGYETVKVADGIYAFISRGPGLGLVSGNSVVIAGDRGALVVDSGQFPTLTRRMIGEIQSLTHQPVRVLVNTHWHGDHNTGNGVYAEAFPGLTILSTEETRKRFGDLRKQFLVAKMWAEQGPVIKKVIETGMSPSGKAVPPDRVEYYRQVYEEISAAYPSLKDAPDVFPNQTFQGTTRIFLGNREVDVMFLGRGNTAGDAVVYVPDSKVLITGDLVVNPTPYALGSFMTEWIETMGKLLAVDANVIVPGHGPIEHDQAYVRAVTDLLKSVTEQAQTAAKSGLTLEEAQKKVDVSRLRKEFTREDPRLEMNFDNFFLTPAIGRAYREAKEGKLNDEN